MPKRPTLVNTTERYYFGAGGTRADRNADFGQRRAQFYTKGKQRDFSTGFGEESVVVTGRDRRSLSQEVGKMVNRCSLLDNL